MENLAKQTDITGMQSAGRVLPLWKGEYNSSTFYEQTDIVLYNNSSYIAKQDTIGNTPPESSLNANDYWQLVAKGIIDADISDATVEFTQAATRSNIQSGEDGKTLFGKISKFFEDLKTIAFTGSFNDLLDQPTIPAAVAVKGNAESDYRTGNVNLTPANIGAVATSKVLTTKEQINANTDTSNVAGATAVKAMVNEINSNLTWQPIDISSWLLIEGFNIEIAEYCQALRRIHFFLTRPTNMEGIGNLSNILNIPPEFKPVNAINIGLGFLLFKHDTTNVYNEYVPHIFTLKLEGDKIKMYYPINTIGYGHKIDITYTY